MKASEFAKTLQIMIEKHGDFDIIAAEDAEGNGYNDVRGIDVVFQNVDDPECIYDSEAEAEADDVENYEPRYLVWV